MAIRKFYRGSATFKCNVCGRGTRDTGDNGSTRLCPQCFELAGIENEISDGHNPRSAYDAIIEHYVGEIRAKGGDVSGWNDTFKLTEGR